MKRILSKERCLFFAAVIVITLALLAIGINQSVFAQGRDTVQPDKAVVVPPVPKLPTGIISDTTPTFKWTRTAGAKKFSFTLYFGTSPMYTKEVLPSACGSIAAYCVTTPATVLMDGNYSWKVKAYVNGTWTAYSPKLAFTLRTIPVLKAPIGDISDTTPTYKWVPVKNATQYTLKLFKNSTLVYTKIVPSSSCTATLCSATPTNILGLGDYAWTVRAYLGGKWYAYSLAKNFSVKTLLKVWSFSNEVMTTAVVFESLHPDVIVKYTSFNGDLGVYQQAVLDSIGTPDEPDVITMEAAFVRPWVEDDFLSNLNGLLDEAATAQTYQIVIDVGTSGGVTKAYSYQLTPGAVFYRRSLATAYFGDDDPAVIGPLLSDWTKFTAAAAEVNTDSGGKTLMVGSQQDFMRLFIDNRTQPWEVSNTLTIDPLVDTLVDTSKSYHDNGYAGSYPQWQEAWFQGMNDALPNDEKIFSYFMPPWGLPYVLMPNGAATAGDWAVVPGPMQYTWGGTWLGVMKNSTKQALATEFVRFATLDETHLTNWATGVYTHEYLAALDPSIPESLSQPSGDFVSSKLVVDAIKDDFAGSDSSDFLGSQNFYVVFADAANGISTEIRQKDDETIYSCLADPLWNYTEGTLTEAEMWTTFKANVHDALPDLIIPE